MREEANYDIMIVGAGPAGATAALALRNSGLRIALIDKAKFPRDKVCGDAIPARALRVLREVAPQSAAQLATLPAKTAIQACTVVAPDGAAFTYHFHTPGYCAKRLDFDAFLAAQVAAAPEIAFFQGETIQSIDQQNGIWEIQSQGQTWRAKMLIGCDGANGVTAKQLTQFELDPQHHCAAVRAYFDGVSGLQADTMEIHLLKDYLPGYFWIFPLNAHSCNVGFGMLSADIAARKVALRPALLEMIAQTPSLATRFTQAKLQGKVQGFGLPLGSRSLPMAGAGFLLCGDAASLIDPATGEGIGNAMWSAQIAAKWALKAFEKADFSAALLAGYANEIQAKLRPELRNKYYAQRLIGNRQWLLNWCIRRANKRGLISYLIKKVF